MRRKKIVWHFFPYYLLIIVLSLAGVYWYAMGSIKQFYLEQSVADLKAKITIIQEKYSELLNGNDQHTIDNLCKDLGKKVQTRFTVIDSSGKVIGDTDKDPATMDNHSDRPEIVDAMSSNKGVSIRYSFTLHEKMIYVVAPLIKNNKFIGFLRASQSETLIDKTIDTIRFKFIVSGLIIIFLASIIIFFLYRKFNAVLMEIKAAAERFAQGDLESRLRVFDTDEIGNLAEALNRMAAQLNDRIFSLIRQRNEMEAVLSSMVEGVYAVDTHERFIRMNEAAGTILGVTPANVQGKSIQEVIKNSDLHKFVKRTLSCNEPVEDEVSLEYNTDERFLQVHGTVLRNEQGNSTGALIVLNDITQMRRLENIRREFVANVSHELKTPITSIKGSVETLLDGALLNPEDARRFLDIIARHTERLNAIIDDLLSLSRIELEVKKSDIQFREVAIKEVLQSAIQACENKAQSKSITTELNCREDIRAKINSSLLEQAVVNLLDNAVKYSESGQSIQVNVERTQAEVVIYVIDHGCGIEREHLPRLFERFYRVDKGRSRDLGGTGLGLSIVKHVVAAHHGTVKVEGTQGRGSTFSIHLPV